MADPNPYAPGSVSPSLPATAPSPLLSGRQAASWPLLVIALALIPLCWWYWYYAAYGVPGMIIGRQVNMLMVLLCLLAGVAVAAKGLWQGAVSWRSPLPWLLLAVVWQVLGHVGWSEAPYPGVIWLAERTAGLFVAIGLAVWWAGRVGPGLMWGMAGFASLIIAMQALGPLPTPSWITAPILGGGGKPAVFFDWLNLGRDPPYGNANFNLGAATWMLALPIGMLLIAGKRHLAGLKTKHLFTAWAWIPLVIGGLVGAGFLGFGIPTGDRAYSVFAVALTLMVFAGILTLPRVAQMPLLIVAGLLAIGGQTFVIVGGEHIRGDLPASDARVWIAKDIPPPTRQRIYIWRSAVEASLAAPILGHGVGATTRTLAEQPSYPGTWLSVPSYAEHAHSEFLQIPVDGGLVLVVLLAAGAWFTVVPLWRRRDEPICAGLLMGWVGWAANAMVESHMSQPGPVFSLALLGGISWAAIAVPVPSSTKLADGAGDARWFMAMVPIAAAVFLAWIVVRDHRVDGGTPTMIQFRMQRDLDKAAQANDLNGLVAQYALMQDRLGPLDQLPYLQAYYLDRLAQFGDAEVLAIAQARRMPLIAGNLELLLKQSARRERAGNAVRAAELRKELSSAMASARDWLKEVPPTSYAKGPRDELEKTLLRLEADGL